MKWRAGASHQLLDAQSRLLRPKATDDLIDDSFLDDAQQTHRLRRPQRLSPRLAKLNDLQLLTERLVDPKGIRKDTVSVGEIQQMNEFHPCSTHLSLEFLGP